MTFLVVLCIILFLLLLWAAATERTFGLNVVTFVLYGHTLALLEEHSTSVTFRVGAVFSQINHLVIYPRVQFMQGKNVLLDTAVQ